MVAGVPGRLGLAAPSAAAVGEHSKGNVTAQRQPMVDAIVPVLAP